MCEPVSGGLALAAFLVGTAVTVQGQQQAAQAAEDAAYAQGEQLNRQAGQEQDAADAQAERLRKAYRRQIGESRAALSASGVSVDEGTALKITDEIARTGEEDALNVILSGSRRAGTLTDEAVNTIQFGEARKRAGQTQAVGSVLSSAASYASKSGWLTSGGSTGSAVKVGDAGTGNYTDSSWFNSVKPQY